jgi:ankyrin repeat protein
MDNWYEKERLHFAAQDGDLESVKTLVNMGYPINAFDKISKTPLHYAVLTITTTSSHS